MDDLSRFRTAQASVYNGYEVALREIRQGQKVRHWIWYCFPQLRGLGQSSTAWTYGIQGLQEAKAYLADPVLGTRLVEISRAMLDQPNPSAYAVLGGTDAMKLRSCMTLFEAAGPEEPVFAQVLDKFYRGSRDQRTLEMLNK